MLQGFYFNNNDTAVKFQQDRNIKDRNSESPRSSPFFPPTQITTTVCAVHFFSMRPNSFHEVYSAVSDRIGASSQVFSLQTRETVDPGQDSPPSNPGSDACSTCKIWRKAMYFPPWIMIFSFIKRTGRARNFQVCFLAATACGWMPRIQRVIKAPTSRSDPPGLDVPFSHLVAE